MGLGATAWGRGALYGGSLLYITLSVGLTPCVVRAQDADTDAPRAQDRETASAHLPEADGSWGARDPERGVPPGEAGVPEPAADEDARATVPPPTRPDRKLVFPIGLDVGWRGDGRTNTAVLGGELSVVWFSPERSMFGGPADGSTGFGLVFGAVWVNRPNHFRGSFGLEVMRFFSESLVAGIDASATFHSRGDPVGFRTRAFLGGFGVMVYAGFDYHGGAGGEAGAMVKLPLGA